MIDSFLLSLTRSVAYRGGSGQKSLVFLVFMACKSVKNLLTRLAR
jgi:hypothetical protein